ncbi:hypothetical protein OPV22_023652 [Ensete ventricosum]|uniref:Golgi SNAP receptor complex member 1 n=1 Tax=Ensete ventricosum TaxID=4639 RepID=A0AAV8QP26_ENSVE|nr:hypothetical protein OPV22_023652 [Ensete ventricosum]
MDASSWDALRKQARKIETQLDDQMSAYRRLVSTKPDGSENELVSGIENLLKQLQQVNLQMQTWVSSGSSQIVSHTLARHKEILQDLTQEFFRLRSGLRAKQEPISRSSGQTDNVISQAQQATVGRGTWFFSAPHLVASAQR